MTTKKNSSTGLGARTHGAHIAAIARALYWRVGEREVDGWCSVA